MSAFEVIAIAVFTIANAIMIIVSFKTGQWNALVAQESMKNLVSDRDNYKAQIELYRREVEILLRKTEMQDKAIIEGLDTSAIALTPDGWKVLPKGWRQKLELDRVQPSDNERKD